MVTDKKKIESLLSKGVAECIVKMHLKKKLLSGKKLICKLGIDPTGADLHIGHMVVIRKLREFQELGHQIVIIVGDYTARIGDPTGRDKMREPLTSEQIEVNMKTWKEQIGKILDPQKTKFEYQTKWFDAFNLQNILELAGLFSVQQLLERDMFQRRIKNDQPIGLHEFMYPLLQGYDSVAIKADIEFGGTDQTFNLLAGRPIQEYFHQEPQDILTVPLLEGLDGRKMSKTFQNHIPVMADAHDMYGKVMSLKDDLIVRYFELTTHTSIEEIQEIKKELERGENPRNVKARLARAIVGIYHGSHASIDAEKEFDAVFRDKSIPSEIPEFTPRVNPALLVEVIYDAHIVPSKSDAKRMFQQGAVALNNTKVQMWDKPHTLKNGDIIRVGKRKFLKIVL